MILGCFNLKGEKSLKRIGIVTLHYSDNYGAVLQTWALRRVLNQLPGCQAEILNYVPKGFGYEPYEKTESARNQLIEKRAKFENFLTKYCGLNSSMSSAITGEGYDYICVGSDQIWNFSFDFLKNFEYLLPNTDKNVIKFSYAASIGMDSSEALRYEEQFRKYLPEFQNLSVREREHVSFVREMSGKPCEHVVVPTLLLDAQEYHMIQNPIQEQEEEPFLLLFWLHHYECARGIELANSLARKFHLKIVHSFPNSKSYMFHKDGGNMNYCGIEEFLALIRKAEFVVTNSYHATLFSIQFETPFYVYGIPSMQSRIDDLKEDYGIGDRVISSYISPELLTDKMDFKSIKENVAKRRKTSMDFLKRTLEVEDQ